MSDGYDPYPSPSSPPTQPVQPIQPSQPVPNESLEKGFLGSLFDFSFSSFVTPKIVRFVYLLATIALAVGYVVLVIAGFARGVGTGLGALVGGAIAFVIYLAFVRMSLEFYYAIVRMSEDINRRLPPGV